MEVRDAAKAVIPVCNSFFTLEIIYGMSHCSFKALYSHISSLTVMCCRIH